ncbi:MAG: hypothetical protein KZQ77_15755 [Candidatus Thiodiazotropha sp. (ex Notomyrtea botanica)]|nr:hypothetical protein [Candidatus Thiodiazotropha sp. (ex Notomyrtea botanica)]
MTKSTICLVALIASTGTNAACIGGSIEIGDIGPSAELVCYSLDSLHPNHSIKITNRHIKSDDHVLIDYTVLQQKNRVDYRLVGFEWMMVEPIVVRSD